MQYFIDYLENTFDTKSVLHWEEIKKTVIQEEKEQIMNAYEGGYKACDLDETLEINKTMFSCQRYYDMNFNQNK